MLALSAICRDARGGMSGRGVELTTTDPDRNDNAHPAIRYDRARGSARLDVAQASS